MKTLCLLLSLAVAPAIAAAPTNQAHKYIDDIYRKSILNLMDYKVCSGDEFFTSKPRQAHDEGEETQSWTKRYTTEIFTEFYADSGQYTGLTISIYPRPTSPMFRRNMLCVLSAIQAAIDPRQHMSVYMQLNSDLYDKVGKSGEVEVSTLKNDIFVHTDSIGAVMFTLSPK